MAESPFTSEVSVTPRLAQGFLLVFVTDDASPWEGGQVASLRVKYGLWLRSCRATTRWRGGLWVLSSGVGEAECERALVFSGIVGRLCKL